MTLPFTDPVYIFALLVLLFWVAPLLAQRLRLPALVVLIGLGALVGSNGLGWLARGESLIFLERIGLLYIMVIAGIQMDLGVLKRLGRQAVVFGALTFGIPFAVGLLSAPLLSEGGWGAMLVGTLYSPHALMAYPIVAALGLVQLEAISITVGGTVLTTVLTLVIYALVQGVQMGNLGLWLGVKLLVLLPLVVGGCWWGLPRLSRRILKPETEANSGFLFVLTCVFLVASLTHGLGVDAIVGAFVTGLALSASVPTQSLVMERLLFVGNSLFIPAFAVSVGVLSDLGALLGSGQDLAISLFLVVGAVGSKWVAAWILSALCHYERAITLTIFGLTVSRSALVLVIGLFGRDSALLSQSSFNALVVYIVVTSLLGPLLVDRFGPQITAVRTGNEGQKQLV